MILITLNREKFKRRKKNQKGLKKTYLSLNVLLFFAILIFQNMAGCLLIILFYFCFFLALKGCVQKENGSNIQGVVRYKNCRDINFEQVFTLSRRRHDKNLIVSSFFPQLAPRTPTSRLLH